MKKIAVAILLIALIVLTYKLWLPLPGTLLLVKDNIRKADCIVPLNGELYFRVKTASELFKQGYGKCIAISVLPRMEIEPPGYRLFLIKTRSLDAAGDPNKASLIRAFKYFGVEPADVYFTGSDVTSTYEEAAATRKFMVEKGFKSMIVVTSAYHMRRTLFLFKRAFKGTGIKIYNCSARGEAIDMPGWWRRERDVRVLITEYVSFIHNIIYHLILHKGRTAFDAC